MMDFQSDFGQHVHERLLNEKVIWLTTVSRNGFPQPNPVWFYWDGDSFFIYTPPETTKLRNIVTNPNVSLHFEGATPLGGDVAVFSGIATIDPSPREPEPGYIRKYMKIVTEEWGRTVDDLFREYCTLIRVQPIRLRGFH